MNAVKIQPGHHTYLLTGGARECSAALKTFLQTLEHEKATNHTEYTYERMGIDDVRDIIRAQSLRPPENTINIITVRFHHITLPAQNAFLKILEEPRGDTVIVLCTSSRQGLLPTLLSRVAHVHCTSGQDVYTDEVTEFLALSPAKRLEQVKALLGSDDFHIVAFVHTLERVAGEHFAGEERVQALRAVCMVEEYMQDTGGSAKLLLEFLALVLPCKKGSKKQ